MQVKFAILFQESRWQYGCGLYQGQDYPASHGKGRIGISDEPGPRHEQGLYSKHFLRKRTALLQTANQYLRLSGYRRLTITVSKSVL